MRLLDLGRIAKVRWSGRSQCHLDSRTEFGRTGMGRGTELARDRIEAQTIEGA